MKKNCIQLFLDYVKDRSSLIFIQSIGRVLRQNVNKHCGFIIDPYISDNSNNHGAELVNKIIQYYLDLQNISTIPYSTEDKIKAFQNIKSFDTDKKFSTWIYRIAHNTFINVIKKNGREPVSFFDFDTFISLPVRTEDTLEGLLDTKESTEKIVDRMKQLSPKYREVLILFYLEELGYKEIADVLSIPISTVGVRIARAKAQLKKIVSPK